MTSAPRSTLSLHELRREGWKALTERLGVSGAIRFLMQYDPGQGDYTTERRSLFADLSLDDVLNEIRQRKPDQGSP